MKKGIVITVILVVILGLIGWKVYPYLMVFRGTADTEFSQEEWNSNVYARESMLKDVMSKYDFIGMSKDEVLNILGEHGLFSGEDSIGYETGGGYMKDEILFFTIDGNGIVTDFGVSN